VAGRVFPATQDPPALVAFLRTPKGAPIRIDAPAP
jgi:hypothetical protein